MILNVTVWVAIAMQVYDQVFNQFKVPEPKRFIAVAVVWALLGIVAELGAYPIAAAFAIGLVVMLALDLASQSKSGTTIASVQKWTPAQS